MTTFNDLVITTANKIAYGVETKEIAAMLVRETESQEQAYLIYMAAKSYLILRILDDDLLQIGD